jgi:hypothetical protein
MLTPNDPAVCVVCAHELTRGRVPIFDQGLRLTPTPTTHVPSGYYAIMSDRRRALHGVRDAF